MLHVLEVWEGVKLCMSVVVLPSSNVPVGFYFVLYQVNYENMQTCSMLLFLKMLSKHQFRLVKLVAVIHSGEIGILQGLRP
jgi:hypothetical protein